MRKSLFFLSVVAVFSTPLSSFAGPGWPNIFNPHVVQTLNIEMAPEDWELIRFDTTNSIEKIATFWMSGEEANKIQVTIRRKSSRALPNETDPRKIGLKIDINNVISNQTWNGLTKVSLENGADSGPVREGVAWAVHEMASVDTSYHAALAAWVNVYLNGEYLGVYVNAEQRDKQFLKNRGIFSSGYGWLYEFDDKNGYELEVGDYNSATFTALCFSPFQTGTKKSPACATPTDTELPTRLNALIDMDAMLLQGAVDAFITNPDGLFSNGKNYFAADSSWGLRRYYPWDLDAVFRQTNAGIYGQFVDRTKVSQTKFQFIILNHPNYRIRYNNILSGLIIGRLSASNMHAFLDAVGPVVAGELLNDPYHSADADTFVYLKSWVTARIASVQSQIVKNGPPTPRR